MFRILIFAMGLALIQSSNGSGAKVRFTSEGIASLKGRDVCDLEGEFPKQLGVDLDKNKEHAVHYQERDGVIAVFLLSKPTDRCGVVDAALDLTSLIKNGENPEFKCYTSREGGTTWPKWGHIVGLADNQNGKRRFVTARRAWRVNIAKQRFEEIKDEIVRCDTSGYEN